jgi:hypothetical protein
MQAFSAAPASSIKLCKAVDSVTVLYKLIYRKSAFLKWVLKMQRFILWSSGLYNSEK